MQKVLGGIAILLSLCCFVVVVPWVRDLYERGWAGTLRRFAAIPLDSAIGCAITALGMILLFVGVSLLQPPRPHN